MILALIRYARFSLSRAPQPCRRSYFFLSRSLSISFLPTDPSPSPSPFSCLLHHLLTPSSVSTLRSHLLETSVLVAVFSLFFRRSFLGAASLSSLLSFLVEYRITDELTFRQRVHTVKSWVTLDRFLNHRQTIHQRLFKRRQASTKLASIADHSRDSTLRTRDVLFAGRSLTFSNIWIET